MILSECARVAAPDLGPPISQLCEMPTDILIPIFGLLDPLDVLHLSRSCKLLHEFLMRRSALSIWRGALSHIPDLPPCPSGMTEPQYIALIFEPLCTYCSGECTDGIFWIGHARCCDACCARQYVKRSDIPSRVSAHDRNDIDIALRSAAYLPHILSRGGDKHRVLRKWYLIKDVELWSWQYLELHRTGNYANIKQWEDERKRTLEERRSFEVAGKTWEQDQSIVCHIKLYECRERLLSIATPKLVELGWNAEIAYLHRTKRVWPDVHLLRAFVDVFDPDLMWSHLKPGLLQIMESTRREYRQRVTLARLSLFKTVLDKTIVPKTMSIADIYLMDPFRTVIDNPNDEDLRPESFADPLKQLSQLTREWHQSRSQELLSIIRGHQFAKEDSLVAADVSPLTLATTFFSDASPSRSCCCDDPISYPEVLVHPCLTMLNPIFVSNLEEDTFRLLGSRPWNYNGPPLQFHEEAYTIARSVVQSCGLDPDVTTAAQMDTVNPLLECLECRDERAGGQPEIMMWRKAVLHALREHPETHPWWRRLLQSEVDAVRVDNVTVEERSSAMIPSTNLGFFAMLKIFWSALF